jgi:hypothetical protein
MTLTCGCNGRLVRTVKGVRWVYAPRYGWHNPDGSRAHFLQPSAALLAIGATR